MDGPPPQPYRLRLDGREVHNQRGRPRAVSPAPMDETITREYASRADAIAYAGAVRSTWSRADYRHLELSGDDDLVPVNRGDFCGKHGCHKALRSGRCHCRTDLAARPRI